MTQHNHLSAECPCGRARAGCEYHDPALQPDAWKHPTQTDDAMADLVRACDAVQAPPAPARGRYQMIVGGMPFYAVAYTVRTIVAGVHELTFDVANGTQAAAHIQAMHNADMLSPGPTVLAVLVPGVLATNSAWWCARPAPTPGSNVTRYAMRWAGAGPQVNP